MTRQGYPRVAIIGGGPAGLAAAKCLSLEPFDFTIDLFERRNQLGGIWNYNKDSSDKFKSPMYKYLETNLQPNLMEYSELHFKSSKTFVNRQEVYDYLLSYIDTISGVNFHLNHNVTNIIKHNGIWNVSLYDFTTESVKTIEYDAIIIANGHFNEPYIPKVLGLDLWNKEHVIHSRDFMDSSYYHGLNVLVVGNSSSGIDIATQVSTTAKTVYISAKNHTITNSAFVNIGIINKYDGATREIFTEDQSYGHIDRIIFCTGYEYDVPFLKTYDEIITPFQIKDLYKQVFYIYDASLSFVCINKNIIPMPLSESQASVIARVYSGRIVLPSITDMERDYQEELKEKGAEIHNFGYPKDVEYYNQFQTILDDNPETKLQGLLPPIWNAKKVEDRSNTSTIKNKRIEEVIEFAKHLKAQGKEYVLMQDS